MLPGAEDSGARPDPVPNAVPGQELVYQGIQSLWSAWARRRYRTELDQVETFALFIGYPRSGHSLVGAMLNAHRHAVISHELDAPRLVVAGRSREVIYSRILARAAWFNLKGNRSNYRYQIPNEWQGRFERLRVIGDKGGGWVAQWIRHHPDLLARVRTTVGVPLRLIHVVRNPFDNIAAISLWHRLSLDQSIEFYFAHWETTGNLSSYAEERELLTVRHEDFIAAPGATLSTVCAFLALEPDPEYLAAASSIVFGQPTRTRRRVTWSADQIREVNRRRADRPFLEDYQFQIEDEAADEGRPTRPSRHRATGPSLLNRMAAYLNPRVRS